MRTMVKVPCGILWPPDPVSCLYPVDQRLCQKTHLDPLKLKCVRDNGTQTLEPALFSFLQTQISDQHGAGVFRGNKTAARSKKQVEEKEA